MTIDVDLDVKTQDNNNNNNNLTREKYKVVAENGYSNYTKPYLKGLLSRLMTKPKQWSLRLAETQISLGIRPVWSKSSQYAQCVAEDSMLLHADSEDWSDWSESSLIWVFAGRKGHFVGFVMRRLYF